MAAPHAFLDILANPQVRDAYLAGRISVILSSDLETILWANGAGAHFLGFRTVADSIGVDSGFDNLTRLQIENGLATNRGVKIGGIPNAQSFLVNAIDMEHLGEVVFLRSIAAVASDGGFVDLTDGLGDEFTEAAVLDLSGNILSATKGFRPDFNIDDELIALLHDAQSGNGIKKCLLKNYSDMPVGILELNKKPAIFLLIAAKPNDDGDDIVDQDKVKQDFVFDTTRFPLRFSWQVDENNFFTDVSPELEIAVGPRFGDILEKSFTSLAKEWNMDSNGAMRALLKSHKSWSERKIYWPVEGGETRVEIEFSALPIYSRDREFSGYRGFGIINEAKMTAKEEGLNLARNRGPKGLTVQEHEAFTAIARKLKADILAVELPRNLRMAQNEEYLKSDTHQEISVESDISEQEETFTDPSEVTDDVELKKLSIVHERASNNVDDVQTLSQTVPVVEINDDPDLGQELEEDISAQSEDLAVDDLKGDNGNDLLHNDGEVGENGVLEQPQNLPEAAEKTDVLAIISDLPTLDEEYAFADDEPMDQNGDSAIDSLLNHYDKNALSGKDHNAKLNAIDTLPKLPERAENSVKFDLPQVANMSHEDDLSLASGSDDDLETALEQEWANDDDLINEPSKDTPEQLDVDGEKDNSEFKQIADDAQSISDASELKTNFSYEDQLDDQENDQTIADRSDSKIEDISGNMADDEADIADIAKDIDDDLPADEEPTIEEALAALRRSLEANGVEAVEAQKEEALDFWGDAPVDEVDGDDEAHDPGLKDDFAPNIDELMQQATFADDENVISPSVLPNLGTADALHKDDQLTPFLYPEDEHGSFALENEKSDELDNHQNRLNLRPADKLEVLVNDSSSSVKSAHDGALPILPSPRIEFTLLQHLPLPILIYRDNRVLFASDELLRLTGFPTLDSFRAHGILSVILREWLPRNILISSNDDIWSVRPQMRGVTWADGLEASMISFGNLEKQDSIDREDFEALQRKAVELSILLNLISDGVLILDDTGLVHSVNEAAQRMLGLEADEIKGRNFLQFFNHKSSDIINQFFDTVRQSDNKPAFGEGYEVAALRSDGENISLFASFGKMELDEGYFLMLRDLSVIHSAASELVVARHQAEEESLRKSRYLALVSHEIRTPLNAIIGLSELILEEKFGSLNNDRYRGYLRDIINSGGHIMTLINDLLDAAKIAEGRTTIDISTVSIVPILKEVLGLMAPQANTGRIIMRSNIAHNLPNIAADKRSVKQIILNLLSNAIRFTPPGGQIIVSALRHDNAGVLLRVRDSGIGMSENEMEEAMLPFHQITKPVKHHDDIHNLDHGTGLGLPLTKALADANNARFNLHSEPGKGTVAEVIFPLAVNLLDDEHIENYSVSSKS